MIWVLSYILTVSHPGLIQGPILLLEDTTFTDSFVFQNSSGIIYGNILFSAASMEMTSSFEFVCSVLMIWVFNANAYWTYLPHHFRSYFSQGTHEKWTEHAKPYIKDSNTIKTLQVKSSWNPKSVSNYNWFCLPNWHWTSLCLITALCGVFLV